MKNIIQSLKIITLGLILAFGISYAFAWTAPTQAPPNGNVSAPMNTSSGAQYKVGDLGVGGVFEVANGANFAVLGGNVGIGTVSPAGIFHVKGAAPNTFIESTTINGPDLFFTGSGTFDGSEYLLYSSGSGNTVGAGKFVIHDETAGLARLIINSIGNVGIGETNPSSKLHINSGDVTIDVNSFAGTGSQKILFKEDPVGYGGLVKYDATNNFLRVGSVSPSGTERGMVIERDTGNVRLGTGTTLPQANLDISGDLMVGGSKICYYSSCADSGGRILCNKKRFDTGATVQTGIDMGFSANITINVAEGQLVICTY